ncbi:MAG: hypothetical protein FMNOHCHN_01688 [Ignavibacteriaceae bacterium]|nr:hypothetical protein [Ignavibacteriaceae bacterium]
MKKKLITLDTDILDIEKEDEVLDETMIHYDITSYPSDYTLSVVFKMWKEGGITIPDFQRRFVWSLKQSCYLIESFLIGLPVPPIFLYIDNVNKNLVIDGQQRLLSIVFFMEEYFGAANEKGRRQVFKLSALNKKSPYFDKKYSDLDPTDQRKLDNSVLRAINIRQLSPQGENTSVYHIFERLNTGGTPLTEQEIRSVVFRGSFYNSLKELNEDLNWRSILGKTLPDKHQKDVELILRVFALTYFIEEYEKPMKEFLNKVSLRNKNSKTQHVKTFIQNFPKICEIIVQKLGQKPFYVRGPLNTSALDAVVCVLLKNINKIPKDLDKRFKGLINNKKFQDYTKLATTDTKIVKQRHEFVKKELINLH